jgi:hypothetical protein
LSCLYLPKSRQRKRLNAKARATEPTEVQNDRAIARKGNIESWRKAEKQYFWQRNGQNREDG